LSTPLRTALDEHVAVETRLGFQGEACRAVEECLWLRLRQIGQEQCLRSVSAAIISACIPVSRAGERVDVTPDERVVVRRLILQSGRIGRKIPRSRRASPSSNRRRSDAFARPLSVCRSSFRRVWQGEQKANISDFEQFRRAQVSSNLSSSLNVRGSVASGRGPLSTAARWPPSKTGSIRVVCPIPDRAIARPLLRRIAAGRQRHGRSLSRLAIRAWSDASR
jgi:hypothetical protein